MSSGWTHESITAYVTEARQGADERYLIEAIRDTTTDPATQSLIDLWFGLVEQEN